MEIGPEGQDDVLRLTFDVDGIREVERFCGQPPPREEWQKHNPRFAYVLLGTRPRHLALDKRYGQFSSRWPTAEMAFCN